jgi:hypothetical protein
MIPSRLACHADCNSLDYDLLATEYLSQRPRNGLINQPIITQYVSDTISSNFRFTISGKIIREIERRFGGYHQVWSDSIIILNWDRDMFSEDIWNGRIIATKTVRGRTDAAGTEYLYLFEDEDDIVMFNMIRPAEMFNENW